MSYRPKLLDVTLGGTGEATLTNHGVLVGAGTSPITQLAVGASGQVLTSNGVGFDPSFQPVSASGAVTTIDGDTGSVTGSTITIFSNNATQNAGSSVSFVNSGSTSTFNVTDSNKNTLVGHSAGNATLSGNQNTSLGQNSLVALTTGRDNTSIGYDSGLGVTTGTFNTIIGSSAGAALTTGQYNTIIGFTSAPNYTSSESSNICIGNNGVTSESNVLRIGTQGSSATQQNKCFIAGITGVTTSNTAMVTINTSTGQLGEAAVPSGSPPASPQVGAAVASSQSAVLIPFIAGSPDGALTGTVNVSNTAMYLVPTYVDEATTYTHIGCRVTNTPGAGSTVDFVIYDSTGGNGLPGALVASATGVDSSASAVIEGSISAALSVGYYWVGIQRNATATVTIQAAGNADGFSFLTNRAYINVSSLSSTSYSTRSFFGANNTYGTYPSNPTITQNQPSNSVPIIHLRF